MYDEDVPDSERLHGWPLLMVWVAIIAFCILFWLGVVLGARAIWRYFFGV